LDFTTREVELEINEENSDLKNEEMIITENTEEEKKIEQNHKNVKLEEDTILYEGGPKLEGGA